MGFFKTAQSRIARRKCYSNTPAFVKQASMWLKADGMLALQSDKDGVFVLLRSTQAMTKIASSGSAYEQVCEDQPENEFRLAAGTVRSICRTLRKLELSEWARECESNFHERGKKCLISNNNLTIKTHKAVVERRITQSPSLHAFAGFSEALQR